MGKTTIHDSKVKETLRLFWRESRKYKLQIAFVILLPMGTVLMAVGVPYFASTILARLAQQNPHIKTALIMLAMCSIIGVLFNFVGFRNMMILQAKTMADLNHLVFDRLLARSAGFHADRISGKLISDASDFVMSYAILTSATIINGLGLALSLVVGLIVVFSSSWQLGFFVLFVVTTTLTWAALESRKRSELRATRLVATKKLIAHLSDSIVNAQTVKTFAQETTESNSNHKLNHTLQHLRIRDWCRAGLSGSYRTGFLLAMQFLLILYVVFLTRSNPAVLAAGIFAFTYTLGLTSRLFEINNLTRQVEESFLQASPMVEMLEEQIEITDKPTASALTVSKGRLEVRGIDFAYDNSGDHDRAVFRNFSLDVAPGERVGLVGPSGGGKSTLTRLLLRFEDVLSGAIYIDNQDISEVTQKSLRETIAYVPQEPLLFHRSIRENIAYSRPDASDEQVIAAAKKANAHEFISSLSKGYDTVVGERGVKLSGGQRQRVAIARAILKDAPLLVLDEATSALDSENEIEVQKALWELMEGRTTIVIAHRLSTIQRMDRIIVLNNGKIVEEGSHKKLLGKKGLYARLWSHQSGGFIEE